MARPVITQEQAKERLAPHERDLVKVVLEPFKRWINLYSDAPAFVVALGNSERAQNLHAHMRMEAKSRFDSKLGVIPIGNLDLFGLFFQPDILLRIKCLENGPQNVRTKRQKALAKQQYTEELVQVLPLEGLDPPTFLTLGYRLSADASEVRTVVIRRDMKGHPPWEYPIYGEDAGSLAIMDPLRGMPTPKVTILRSKKKGAAGKQDKDSAQG